MKGCRRMRECDQGIFGRQQDLELQVIGALFRLEYGYDSPSLAQLGDFAGDHVYRSQDKQ